jgi:hypothetical protein
MVNKPLIVCAEDIFLQGVVPKGIGDELLLSEFGKIPDLLLRLCVVEQRVIDPGYCAFWNELVGKESYPVDLRGA